MKCFSIVGRGVLFDSIHFLPTVTVHKPPSVNSHRPEPEKCDRCCHERQGSTHRLAPLHVDRCQPKEKSNEKDQSEYDDRSRDLAWSSKILLDDPRGSENAEAVEAGNRCI